MSSAFIYDTLRTPRGKAREGGALNNYTAWELQSLLIDAVQQRTGLSAVQVQDIVLGCVTQIGEQGGNIAKVAALFAGLPSSVPGITVNRYCTSGLDAIHLAAMKVLVGDADCVLAGGVETMSRVPMMSDKASFYSDPKVARKTRFVPMGLAADLIASLEGITRQECDAYAVESQRRAARAQGEARFARSLVSVPAPNGALIDKDEAVRGDVTTEKLAGFDPLFQPFGEQGYAAAFQQQFPGLKLEYMHHSGNSPAMVDGASLALIGSEQLGRQLGLQARARIVAMATVCASEWLALTGGIEVVGAVLKRAGMQHSDIDLIEFNEAFAGPSIKFLRVMPWNPEQVNPNGGAIALGHAMGATGTSLVGTVLDELERQDKSIGLIAVSGAAGIGSGLIIERLR